jgi:L-threonylcarbamoyladenylate synthase
MGGVMEIATHLISRLESNEVIVFPTSTQPGLACLPTKEGLDNLFKIKLRDASKPVSLGVTSLDDVRQLVRVPEHAQEFLDSFTPGSITLLMEAINEQDQRLGGKVMAIRILAHPLAKKLAECVGPITATSANLAGTTVSSDLFSAAESLGLPMNAVLVGECEGGSPSTLVQLGLSSTSLATVMREGVVPTKDVMAWRSRER